MNVSIRFFILFVLLSTITCGDVLASNEDTSSDREPQYALSQFDDATASLELSGEDSGGIAYARSIAQLYEKLRGVGSSLDRFDDIQLLGLYRATVRTIFYTNDAAYLDDLSRVFNELSRRALLNDQIKESMRNSLVRMRALERLHHLVEMGVLANSQALPPVSFDEGLDRSAPMVLRIDDSGDGLSVTNASIGSGLAIIVTYGPDCSPSKNALVAISSDEELSPLFHERALWLIPVDSRLYLSEISQIASHPAASNVAVAYSRTSWPQVDSWSTPMFYFLNDGAVVHVVRGWPSAYRLREIRQVVRSLQGD